MKSLITYVSNSPLSVFLTNVASCGTTALRGISLVSALAFLLMYQPPVYGIASICDAVSGNIVGNCGFEASNSSFAPWVRVGSGSFNTGSPASANSGNNYFNLFNVQPALASLSQNITTVAGQQYLLTYYLALPVVSTPSNFDNIQVVWDVGGANQAIVQNLMNPSAFGYTPFSFLVTASSNVTLLSFQYHSNQGFKFDDVSLVAVVPEPSTWLALGSILGLVTLVRARLLSKKEAISL